MPGEGVEVGLRGHVAQVSRRPIDKPGVDWHQGADILAALCGGRASALADARVDVTLGGWKCAARRDVWRGMETTRAFGRALLLALALTACSPATSTTGTPTTAATTAATSVATAATQVTTLPTPVRPGRCVSSGLRASFGQSRVAAGTSYVALLLTNRSRVTCTLDGYPGVSFVAGTDALQIGAPAQRDRRVGAAPVILVPGAAVHATVEVANYANYDQQACQPVRATGFRIFPPGSTGSLLIAAPRTVCSKPGVQSFQTSVVRTGTIPD
jgi:hypothetical protein